MCLCSTANGIYCMYAFVIFREASLVQLKSGMNGDLYTQKPGQTTTLRDIFLTICERFVGPLISPANQRRCKRPGLKFIVFIREGWNVSASAYVMAEATHFPQLF